MKKLLLIILTSVLMIGAAYAVTDNRWYMVRTGGGTGALDKQPVASLENGDRSVVFATDGVYNYIFDSSSTDAEDDPWRIRPDDYSSAGVHEKIPEYGYIQLVTPHMVGSGVQAGPDTTSTNEYYGQVLFADEVDLDTNYVEYRLKVPDVFDPNVALVAWFKFRLAGADTATQRYEISMDSVADSADYSGTDADHVFMDHSADGSGADGDVETIGPTTLTGWAAALTAGELWIIRLARDGNASPQDASTVDSYTSILTIRYGK